MGYFLRKEIRERLKAELEALGAPAKRCGLVTDFQEGEEDAHMAAHAAVCIKAATKMPRDQGHACLAWSGACILAIGEEARRRGLSTDHFPQGATIMDEFNAACAAEEAGDETKH